MNTHTHHHYPHPPFFFLLMALLWLGGCVAYDLDYAEVDYAEFQIVMDWSRCPEEMMHDGATVIFYPAGNNPVKTVLIAGVTEMVRLKEGNYSVIGFNQTFDDFSYIDFRNRERYNEFEAYARYTAEKLPTGEQKVYEPEILASASVDSFSVTKEMVDLTRTRVKSRSTDLPTQILIRPIPLVLSIALAVWVDGLEHVRPTMALGTMKGMAEGVNMASRRNNGVRTASTFQMTPRFSSGSTGNGQLIAQVSTFGMVNEVVSPNVGTQPLVQCVAAAKRTAMTKTEAGTPDANPPGGYELYLDLTLKDKDKTKVNMVLDLSKMLTVDPEKGMVVDVEANNPDNPDAPPPVAVPSVPHEEENESGFDADVGDWDEEIGVDIPL